MNHSKLLLVIVSAFLFGAASVMAETGTQLAGEIGQSSQWGSGWLDLESPTDFKSGDKLRLTVRGPAKNIKVRLLPKGKSPETSAGMLDDKFSPKNRRVEITLKKEHPKVIQILVHGGPNPWGKYPLGQDNGPAVIESAVLVRP